MNRQYLCKSLVSALPLLLAAGLAEIEHVIGKEAPVARAHLKLTPVHSLGKPLPLIPFVFHGPRHFLPNVDKLPLCDIISVNLDHFRLDADFKHGKQCAGEPGDEREHVADAGAAVGLLVELDGGVAG